MPAATVVSRSRPRSAELRRVVTASHLPSAGWLERFAWVPARQKGASGDIYL